MNGFLLDARQTIRTLVRHRAFTLSAVATIALAIAANTLVLALIEGVLLRPLPLPRPNAVLRIEERHEGRPVNLTGATLADLRARSRTLAHVAGYRLSSSAIRSGDEPRRVAAATVTSGYLAVLGVAPIAGRAFESRDFEPGARVVLLHERLWTQAFGRDATLVGRTISVDAAPAEVIGILPAAAYYPGDPEVFVPIGSQDTIWRNRRSHLLTVIARVADGTSYGAATAELAALSASITADSAGADGRIQLEGSRLGERLTRAVRPAMFVVWAAVGLVLLIACANVAGLLLARSTARARDLAIRLALGCGQRRLFRHVAMESLIVAIAGGVFGVALAAGAMPAVRTVLPASLPRAADISVDWRVLASGLLLSVVMAAIFGTLPSARAARVPAIAALRSRDGSGQSAFLRTLVVSAQIAITVILLVGTGLLGRSMALAAAISPGFDPENVVVIEVSLPRGRYADAAADRRFFDAVLERVTTASGVTAAGVTDALPLGGTPATDFSVDGAPEQRVTADVVPASIGYFPAMRIPLLSGRAFGAADRTGGTPVAIVSQSAARSLFPQGTAIGRRVTMHDWGEAYEATVVGVVGDVHQNGLEAAPSSTVYYPLAQFPSITLANYFVVRHTGNATAVMTAARAALAAVDPGQPTTRVTTFADILARSLAERRFNAMLVTAFGAIALALAAVGVYGLVAFVIAARRRELAVRVALGATPGRIARLALSSAGRPVAAGVTAGVIGALIAGRAVQAVLFGIAPGDAVSLAGAVVAIAILAAAASAIPVVRLLRADPRPALQGD